MEPSAAGRRDAFAAHEDFDIGCDRHILTFQDFSEGTCFGIDRVIDGNHRAGFRQAIALNHSKTQSSPEFLKLGVDAGSAHNESPELPAETSMNHAMPPHGENRG